jgi:hypothetical protein
MNARHIAGLSRTNAPQLDVGGLPGWPSIELRIWSGNRLEVRVLSPAGQTFAKVRSHFRSFARSSKGADDRLRPSGGRPTLRKLGVEALVEAVQGRLRKVRSRECGPFSSAWNPPDRKSAGPDGHPQKGLLRASSCS